jgi:hypothetical protein
MLSAAKEAPKPDEPEPGEEVFAIGAQQNLRTRSNNGTPAEL